MEEGDAASWKQQLIEEMFDRAILAGTDPNFGTIGNFIGTLKDAFEPYDSEGDTLEEMKVNLLCTPALTHPLLTHSTNPSPQLL